MDDPEVERWLREVAVPIAEATLADPSRSIPADDVREYFARSGDSEGTGPDD